MGEDNKIIFLLKQNADKIWKITDIFYPSNNQFQLNYFAK